MSRNKRTNSDNAANSTEKAEPAAKAEKVDHVANLLNAVEVFRTDANVVNLQTVYRAIPAASRGPAMGRALKASGDLFDAVLDALNDLPSIATSRTKLTLSDDEVANVRSLVVDALRDMKTVELGEVSDLYRESVSGLLDRLVEVAQKAPIGTTRTHKRTTFADLVADGSIPAGTVLHGPNNATCVVNADASVTGTVENVEVSGSLSSVAGKFVGHSQNGWSFWRIDGNLVDGLRTV